MLRSPLRALNRPIQVVSGWQETLQEMIRLRALVRIDQAGLTWPHCVWREIVAIQLMGGRQAGN